MQQLPKAMPAHVAQAFDDYYAMGADRSLRGLHALYKARGSGKPEPPSVRLNTLGEWSKRYNWQDTVAVMNAEEAMAGRLATAEAITMAAMQGAKKLVELLDAKKTIVTPTGETFEVPDLKIQLAAANSLLDRAGHGAVSKSAVSIAGADGGPVQVDHRHLHAELDALTPAELLARLQDQALGDDVSSRRSVYDRDPRDTAG